MLPYLHYDVFTSTPLLGNQLAVFPDARGLTTEQMQAIAREINFSESTFILPAESGDTDVRMRIFTPAVEMPMAGHPTVGSTFALAHTGAIAHGRTQFVFGLNVGPTPVDLEWEGERLRFVWMTQGRPVFGAPVADRARVATALGLEPADLAELPIQEVSCGVPYLLVPLRDGAAVDRATPNGVSLLHLPSLARPNPAVVVFAGSPVAGSPVGADLQVGQASTYSRMFAPGLGVSEDPATGSAAGPLGCYLVQHGRVSGEQTKEIVNAQGVKMGRASRIHISIGGTAGAITVVKVGGEAVLIAHGEFLATAAR